MSIRIPMLVTLCVLLTSPAIARSQTTDEARALAGRMLPQPESPRPVPPGFIPSTTDEAREMAGRVLPRSSQGPARVIQAVGTTDEARAVAGGLLVVAPAAAKHETIARCGNSGNCAHRG